MALNAGAFPGQPHPVGWRVFTLAAIYFLASAALLGLIFDFRSEAFKNSARTLQLYSRMVEARTTEVLALTEETLQAVAAVLRAHSHQLRDEARRNIDSLDHKSDSILEIMVFGIDGHLLHSSGDSIAIALTAAEAIDAARIASPWDLLPAKPRRAGERHWLPAAMPWRDSAGTLLGTIVVAIDAEYLFRIWTAEHADEDVAIVLLRADGTLLLRAPYVASLVGSHFVVPQSGKPGDARREGEMFTTDHDGRVRLSAVRATGAGGSNLVLIGQGTDTILAVWKRLAWIVAILWAVGTSITVVTVRSLRQEWIHRRRTGHRYRELFNATPYPLFAVSRDDLRLLAVNDAALERYGWTREEFLAMSKADLHPDEEEVTNLQSVLRHAGEDFTQAFEGRHRLKDGTVIDVEIGLRSVDFEGQRAFLSTARDVTARKRAEEAHQRAEEQLRQAQKMESVGQLTGGVAHDFNNILAVILANVEALEEDLEGQSGPRERVAEINGAVVRATDLVKSLLAFSRMQRLRPEVTNINDVLIELNVFLCRAIGETVTLEASLSPELWLVVADRGHLQASIVNLCVNSRDAMPDGGMLLIETSNIVLDEEYTSTNPDVLPGEYVLLSVSDTGVGIPPDLLDKVFEPFFTTKEVGRGSGLGLSMVYGFIKQSNGHIRIYSEPGGGTTVKLYLPRTSAARTSAREGTAVAVPTGTEHIMVVEDNADVRRKVVGQLQGLGYQVIEAHNGLAAIETLRAGNATIDLVLTDVIMTGGLSGRDVAEYAAKRLTGTRIVLMSGHTQESIAGRDGLPPAVRLLMKPFRRLDLARVVRQALDA